MDKSPLLALRARGLSRRLVLRGLRLTGRAAGGGLLRWLLLGKGRRGAGRLTVTELGYDQRTADALRG